MSPSDFDDLFAPESPVAVADEPVGAAWQVLLVDDEPDMHAVLRLVLRELRFEGRALELLDAYSAAQAQALLHAHSGICLVLLDVVMESDTAGLSLVQHIRQDLGNRTLQILLITGQPGQAPQRQVVSDYDIDGYCLKSELTPDRIYSSVFVALRAHRALESSAQQRAQMEQVTQDLQAREARLHDLVERGTDALLQLDAQGVVISVNDTAAALMGTAASDLLGHPWHHWLPSEQAAACELIRTALATPAGTTAHLGPADLDRAGSDGRTLTLELAVRSWDAAAGRVHSVSVRDVTEQRRAEQGLRLAASAYANSYEGIIITDPQQTIVDVNPAFTRITGYTREMALGQTPRLLASGQHDGPFYARLWRSVQEQGFWQGEICNRRADGTLYREILSLSVIRDRAGQVQHYIGVFSDISQLQARESEFYRVAHYDPLTGMPNRRLLSERLAQATAKARRDGLRLAVCAVDLDGFRTINEQWGHATGDQMLKEIALRLQQVLRSQDTLARLGGDDFVLLLEHLHSNEECQAVLQRALRAVTEPVWAGGRLVQPSACVGFTVFPEDDGEADDLLRHAEQALHQAKGHGRNSLQGFDPEQDRRHKTQRHHLERLTDALGAGELVLYYQPKVHLQTGAVLGFEALLRWQHPEKGLLLPAEFLHSLEGTALEVSLGEWVIASALRQMALWQTRGLRLQVSVNIAAGHLLQASFAARLQALLEAQPSVLPRQLELEIVEAAALTDLQRAVRVISQCRALGVDFALDDFGTGYSSLTYFLNLPVQWLKIDQSFVRVMLEDPEGLGIVQSVVRLAQTFNRPVIAEGVESVSHGAVLLHLGCPLAQGFGIARPMPAQEVSGWLEQWRSAEPWGHISSRVPKGDVVLQAAAQSHRAWVERVRVQIMQPDLAPLTLKDTSVCSFGRWYRGSGAARYAGYPEYESLKPLHDRAHTLARDALALARAGQLKKAGENLVALLANREQLVGQIEQLAARLPRP